MLKSTPYQKEILQKSLHPVEKLIVDCPRFTTAAAVRTSSQWFIFSESWVSFCEYLKDCRGSYCVYKYKSSIDTL